MNGHESSCISVPYNEPNLLVYLHQKVKTVTLFLLHVIRASAARARADWMDTLDRFSDNIFNLAGSSSFRICC